MRVLFGMRVLFRMWFETPWLSRELGVVEGGVITGASATVDATSSACASPSRVATVLVAMY